MKKYIHIYTLMIQYICKKESICCMHILIQTYKTKKILENYKKEDHVQAKG